MSPIRATFVLPAWTLCRREILRFVRQRSRIVGALGTPLVFWLLAGWGLAGSFHLPGGNADVSYLQYTYPGAIAAILLFTAIFSMFTIIDDRKSGFMQGVLVAPVSRSAIVLGKVLGATALAVGQAALFLVLAPLIGIELTYASVVASLAAMTLFSLAVTSLGFWMAWLMDSVQGFHVVMNLLLMPMLVLSGALFPPSGSASVVRYATEINPLTYAVALMRHAMYAGGQSPGIVEKGLAPSLVVTLVFALAMFGLSVTVANRDAQKALA